MVSRDTAGVIAPPPLIYLAGLVLGRGADWLLDLPALPERSAGGGLWLGLAFGGLGLLLILWAGGRFFRAGTPLPPHRPATALVTEGPYRRSRNPIYLGLALIYLGVVCATASLGILVSFPLVILVMEFGVIRREERYLERRFGRDYLDYKARVRRWL
ncbi:isoprenylcysteine carboxylmethyltransferase family protein [Pelagibius sp. CAU 1746]|uniref:methyltransferase family protein n=1 Tax=Pelagibius sp. CAU 1746 TaxID=3140370 RepID=UPI00325A5B6A